MKESVMLISSAALEDCQPIDHAYIIGVLVNWLEKLTSGTKSPHHSLDYEILKYKLELPDKKGMMGT
jgi:hypothetical protein